MITFENDHEQCPNQRGRSWERPLALSGLPPTLGFYGLCSQEQVDHILRVANSTPGHLILLLTMAEAHVCIGSLWVSQQGAMGNVLVALTSRL
jgi:hypothetical protein